MTLRQLIDFYEPSETYDAYGAVITNSFVKWKRCFADVKDMSGTEKYRQDAGQRLGEATTVFTIRNQICRTCGGVEMKQPTPAMKIRYANQDYNIISVLPNSDRRYIVITANRDETPNV